MDRRPPRRLARRGSSPFIGPAASGARRWRPRSSTSVGGTVADLPPDFQSASDEAWRHVRETPGYLAEREARFLILAAACAPATGAIGDIRSFQGRCTEG